LDYVDDKEMHDQLMVSSFPTDIMFLDAFNRCLSLVTTFVVVHHATFYDNRIFHHYQKIIAV
jgi:hypothetical protein